MLINKTDLHTLFRSLTTLGLTFFIIGITFGQSKKDLEIQREKINREIERTTAVLSQTKKDKKATVEEFMLVEKQIKERETLLNNIQSGLDAIQEDISINNLEKDSLFIDIQHIQKQYNSLLRKRHIQHLQQSKWQYILSANGFKDGMLRMQQQRQLENYYLAKKNQLNNAYEDYNNTLSHLEKVEIESQKLALEEVEVKSSLNKQLIEKQSLLQTLEKNSQSLKKELIEKNKSRERLNLAIEKAIELAIRNAKDKQRKEKKGTILKTTTKVTSTFSIAKSTLHWPSNNGVIVSAFGKQPHPSIKGLYIENNGIDIKLLNDKKVLSVFNGKVISIQTIPGHNIMIMVQHGEYYTIYSKLSSNSVNIGQEVSQGDILGEVEKNVLHFEIWKGKQKLNPNSWLKK